MEPKLRKIDQLLDDDVLIDTVLFAMQAWHAGGEARIARLKHTFGMNRTRYRGANGVARCAGRTAPSPGGSSHRTAPSHPGLCEKALLLGTAAGLGHRGPVGETDQSSNQYAKAGVFDEPPDVPRPSWP
jgi:hypothetical protein